MRELTNKEFFKISEDPYELKLLKQKYTSAVINYLVKNLKIEDAKEIIKLMKKEYSQMWKVCISGNKIPDFGEIINLIEKYYGTHKNNS